MEFTILILSVLLTTAGQVLQKLSATQATERGWQNGAWFSIVFLPSTLIAIACLASGTALWLYVLANLALSVAYPFLSLGFVLILLYSNIVLEEPIPLRRWLGVVVIIIGIFIVSHSHA